MTTPSNSPERPRGAAVAIGRDMVAAHPQTFVLVGAVATMIAGYLLVEGFRETPKGHTPSIQTRAEQAEILAEVRNQPPVETMVPRTDINGRTVMVPAVLTIGPDGKPSVQLREVPPAGTDTIAAR